MATINIPTDIIFPLPKTDEEALLYKTLQEYFIQIKQTLLEIESKLP